MAKSILDKLKGISDVQKNGDQKLMEQEFLKITTDLDKKLDVSAKEGKRSFIVCVASDKEFNWKEVDGKGQQTKIFLARRARGLFAQVLQHCKDLELDPEIELCQVCSQARIVIRW